MTQQQTQDDAQGPRTEIVIADRGWVFVGRATVADSGDVVLREAQTIRIWGTTRGLGQLALEGPQENTVLDPCGTVLIPARSVIARMPCARDDGWR